MTDKNNTPNFEDAYRELGEIVDRLESGELSLDESVTLYERGRQLIILCEKYLDAADLRVSRLSGDAETGFTTEPLA